MLFALARMRFGQAAKLHPSYPKVVFLMVVQAVEFNLGDQRGLEFQLWKRHQVRVIRRTLSQIGTDATLDVSNNLVIGNNIVAVTYFRAGYTPRDYPSDLEWKAVASIERSTSIKCPSIGHHLAGTKKIQQAFSRQDVLERYLDKQAASNLMKCFTGLWSIDDDSDETRKLISQVIESPGEFVLKPQREGGGNNLWNDDMKLFLQNAKNAEERSPYILMKKIKAIKSKGYLMHAGVVTLSETTSELGIFGACISDGQKVLRNEVCGHLLRTKVATSNEGGLAVGLSVLDSPYLY